MAVVCLLSCSHKRESRVTAPFGEIAADTIPDDDHFDLSQIQSSGEMIMATLTGPDTYYDYQGKALGTQYLICQKFADKLGVRLRVEVCRDSAEIAERISGGDVDIVAYATPGDIVVSGEKPELEREWSAWYRPAMVEEARKEERGILSTQRVRRKIFSPMLDRSKGIISHYDGLFMTYSATIRWDWRLMAAQCYQESTFDPRAVSWAGAKGLMQIMPGTADHLGLPRDKMFDPESNIAAAARYISELEAKFGDIPSRYEKTNFVLACYNGGYHHIRDAMALAKEEGRNPYSWEQVSHYVLLLSDPKYYQHPVVKHGYMRGSETVDYVDRIRQRWNSYRGVKRTASAETPMSVPQKAKRQRKQKFNI